MDRQRIIIVKNRALGDAIMGLSAVGYMRSLYPSAHITYVVPKWIYPLFDNVEGKYDQVTSLDLKNALTWLKELKHFLGLKFDAIHECHQAGRSQKFFNLISKLKNVPYTAHNHHLDSNSEVRDHGVIKPVIQRDLDGIYTFFAKDQEVPSFLNFEPKLRVQEPKKDKSIILGIVATRETKMWPLEYYNDLIKQLNTEYPQHKIKIPLSKSELDQNLKKQIHSKDVIFIEKPLSELPLEMAKANLYIGNDTGIKHLAIALGLPTLSFFGPEPPLEWHPYSTKKHKYFYIDNLECRTIKAHYCDLSTCDSMICLNQISVDQVMNECRNIL